MIQNSSGYVYTAANQNKEYFDTNGLEISVATPDEIAVGLATNYSYDMYGRLIEVVAPDGGVTTLNYGSGSSGLLTSIDEPGGRVVYVTHSSTGDLTSITDADRNVRTLTYDSTHHVIEDQWRLT